MPPVSPEKQHTITLDDIQRHVWQAKVPLEVRLSASESRLYDQSEPYMICFPRLSYLPFLLPKLLNYFSEDLIAAADEIIAESGFFSFDGVPLKWHLPIGLLYDIHMLSTQDVSHDGESTRALGKRGNPFRLTVHFSTATESDRNSNTITPSPAIVHDAFINSVKEADFLRSGSAKPIMSLNATDSKLLWTSTQENDLTTYARIHAELIPRDTPLRNIPLRVYLPTAATEAQVGDGPEEGETVSNIRRKSLPIHGQIRVIQSQIPPFVTTTAAAPSQLRLPSPNHGSPQTLGTALHTLLPALFPSRRTPILAKPLLHGAVMPMNAVLEEVASKACYADGWINIVVAISA